jgi:hypothetical protein
MGGIAPSRRRLLLLAGILTVDVVMVALALRPRAAVELVEAAPVGVSTPDANVSSPVASGEPSPALADPALLADLSEATAIRVTSPGSCDNGVPEVGFSVDQGRTWIDVDVPVSTVLRVRVTGARSAVLVGAGQDCRPTLYQTGDAGASWSPAGTTDGTWHRYNPPEDRLHAPARVVRVPCGGEVALTDLAPFSLATAAVLCADGAVYGTARSGASWTRRDALPGAVALNHPTEDTLVAVIDGQKGCDGLGVQTSTDGGARWTVTGCIEDATAGSGVALTFTDADRGLLVTGDATFGTADGGASWSAA